MKMYKKILATFALMIFVSLMPISVNAQLLNVPQGVGVKDFGEFRTYDSGSHIGFDEEFEKTYILLNNGDLYEMRTDRDGKHTSIKMADNVEKVKWCAGYNLHFIKNDNTLWGWGVNNNYELGIGHNNPVAKPVKILDDVKEVYPMYAMKTDNSIWGWGENTYSRFGSGEENRDKLYTTPIKILENIRDFQTYKNAARYLTFDNELYIIGFPYTTGLQGESWQYSHNIEHTPRLIAQNVASLDKVGYDIALAFIKTDGTVWGNKEKNYANYHRTPKKIYNSTDEAPIFEYHALRSDGSLWLVAGKRVNQAHEVGIEIREGYKTSAEKIIDDVKRYYTSAIVGAYVIKNNGELWGWGYSTTLTRFNAKYEKSIHDPSNIYYTPQLLLSNIDEIYITPFGYYYKSLDGSLYICDSSSRVINEHIQLVKGGGAAKQAQSEPPKKIIKVMLDGRELNFDSPVINKNNITFYPMRELFEALGAEVSWNETTRTAKGTLGDNSVEFTIDKAAYSVNGSTKTMEAAAFIQNGNTYIPIRHAAEGLDFTVEWNGASNTINISK